MNAPHCREVDLCLIAGRDEVLAFTATEHNGDPFDLSSGWVARFLVKSRSITDDADALFVYQSDDAPTPRVVILDAPGGTGEVQVAGTDTDDPRRVWYRFDILHAVLAPEGYTIQRGELILAEG